MTEQTHKNLKLSPNFTLGEFLAAGDTEPPASVVENLRLLAQRLQVLRDILGKPIKINSGYRSPAYNKKVGGAAKSMHLFGMAVDIQLSAADQKLLKLDNWSGGYGKAPTWCHLDIRAEKARWNY